MDKMKNSPEKRSKALCVGPWSQPRGLVLVQGRCSPSVCRPRGHRPRPRRYRDTPQTGGGGQVNDGLRGAVVRVRGGASVWERVVLVGHSMGGAAVAMAMERFPEKIVVAVFAAAMMPGPDLVYVDFSKEDYVIKEDLERWMIEKNPVDEVRMILGSDHMVMFCKPVELCSHLREIAESYS
ncbi:hypothetical protein CDL15_Pgr013505 [Punica granatum]|uniref:AB hydrolase-1 domain-containing protein n=1 Tax=Punica granatum TaxID=22663 RepID=A0A218W1E2_PUNGR|nr:hypothetical protein CDL15_Pgr013505 [Punica granatum]